MGQLLQLTSTWLAICALGTSQVFAQPAKEPDFCALRVTLLGYGGQPLRPNVPVPIKIASSEDGEVWRSVHTADGTLEVCDVDPDPFDVIVGFDGGGQVVVRKLRMFWNQTLNLRVVWPAFSDTDEHLPWNGCKFFVKVRDAGGSPIPDSVVSVDPYPDRTVDSYGRIMFGVRAGATKKAVVRAPGFRKLERSFSCPAGSEDQRVTIRLSRDQGKTEAPDQPKQ